MQQGLSCPVDLMFQELNQLAMQEQVATAHYGELNNNTVYLDHEDVINRVDSEFPFYKQEQQLPVKKEDRCYNNLMDFWCLKQQQYPLLAKTA